MKPLHHKTHTLAKRGLSLLCVLALCLGLLPVTALAEGAAPDNLYVGDQVLSVGRDSYWTTSTDGKLITCEATNDWTVKYEPTSATLTLKNATIEGVLNAENIASAGIYAASSSGPVSLNIVLVGENKVTGVYGINVSSEGAASLSITDSGSLTVSATAANGIGIFVQAQSDANLTIDGANVNAVVTETNGRGVELSTRQAGEPNLTIEVKGGSLQASGQPNGIKFFTNANDTHAKANLKVSGNAMVKTSGITTDADGSGSQGAVLTTEAGSGETGGIVFDGSDGTVYGAVTLQEDLEIGEGESLTIGDGASLDTNGKLTVNGGTLNGTPSGDVTYKVTGVSLNKTSLTLTEGGSETLTATIAPSKATNQNVAWSSSDSSIVTVGADQTDNTKATVKALKEGSATITATAADGSGKSDTCTVTVTAKTYSLSVDPATLNFGSITEGDALPAAQEVTITNTGNQRVTLVQPTAENFEIGKLSETTLAPNATATFTIQPKDNLSRGSYSEQITITDSNNVMLKLTATFTVKEPPYTGKYSYEVSTSVGDHGSLTVDRYATEGDEVTISVSPDEAYKLDDLSVTAGGKEVTLTAGGDGTYTFTMPSADVKITATFAEDPDWTEPEEPVTDVSDIFLDVTPNAWYKDAVQYAYDSGLMTGVSATEFDPEATTTRAMIVAMLARLEGVESAESAGFTDVAANDWYATAVNWAAASGITSGTGDGNFSPNTAITREQLAAILMNYAQYKGQDVSARATLDTYNDAAAISSWANDTMSWAVAEGLISGVTSDELQPQGNATRAQVAAILERFLAE